MTTYSQEYQGRMRKYYSLTQLGHEELVRLKDDWDTYTNTINGIIEGASAMTRTEYMEQLEKYLKNCPTKNTLKPSASLMSILTRLDQSVKQKL